MNLRVGQAEGITADVTTLQRLQGYNDSLSAAGGLGGEEPVKTVKAFGSRWYTQLKFGVKERSFVFAAILFCLLMVSLPSQAEDTLYWNTNTSKVTADIRNTDLSH